MLNNILKFSGTAGRFHRKCTGLHGVSQVSIDPHESQKLHNFDEKLQCDGSNDSRKAQANEMKSEGKMYRIVT